MERAARWVRREAPCRCRACEDRESRCIQPARRFRRNARSRTPATATEHRPRRPSRAMWRGACSSNASTRRSHSLPRAVYHPQRIMDRVRRIIVDEPNVNERVLDEAVCAIHAGGVVAVATETLYGLAADPFRAESVERIFAVKGRVAG